MEKYQDPYAPQGMHPPPQAYPPPPQQAYPLPPPQAYPPPPGYPPQQNYPLQQGYPPSSNVVQPMPYAPLNIVQQNIIVATAPVHAIFGRSSVLTYCDSCNLNVTTRSEPYVGCMVWLMFFIFILLVPCISWVPFITKTWFNVAHYCPRCTRKLGTFAPV
ncbi:hypothetical protein SteCoe_14954 [Stentor coeruleus]|uniref:LITAF domain-containing protein n=1 Tax=Stentor coeruleus TaxID=5963 RepID=A0A1R2C4S5_9CILI|nr:hypothetical protein SteCoe_14954 [Stentor coeruleus]